MSIRLHWSPSTLSQAGSPANLFRWREGEILRVLQTHDGSGHSFIASSVKYDQTSSSWKTSRGSISEEVPRSLLILPRSGTMQNGTLYLQRPLVPRTSGSASSLWRTPDANTGQRGWKSAEAYFDGDQFHISLNDQVRWTPPEQRWPTPTARDYKDVGENTNYQRAAEKARLAGAVGGPLNPMWVEWLMGFPTGWTVLEDSETP